MQWCSPMTACWDCTSLHIYIINLCYRTGLMFERPIAKAAVLQVYRTRLLCFCRLSPKCHAYCPHLCQQHNSWHWPHSCTSFCNYLSPYYLLSPRLFHLSGLVFVVPYVSILYMSLSLPNMMMSLEANYFTSELIKISYSLASSESRCLGQ